MNFLYSQCAYSKISHEFFPKRKAIADMKYINFILFLRNRAIYSLYLKWSIANICTGFISEKKQKSFPCRAIESWFLLTHDSSRHFTLGRARKKSVAQCGLSDWQKRCHLPFAQVFNIERERERWVTKLFFSFSLFCFCL